MDDYKIHDVVVSDVQGVDANLQPTITKRVTFKIGAHSSFIRLYSQADYTPDRVQADMQREVETLRAIGATAHTGHA
jgi:hypothetical protein